MPRACPTVTSCGEAVVGWLILALAQPVLSTGQPSTQLGWWKKQPFNRPWLHKKLVQFYAAKWDALTDMIGLFSPLSTPLTISPIWSNKEIQLIGHGG